MAAVDTTTTGEIPPEMRRLIVTSPGASVADCKIEIETVSTPTPTYTQVLVKVSAAAVNPSDYGSWYKSKKESYPMPMGFEGSGVVVATGGKLASLRFPIGTQVGFIKFTGGSYSEYVAVNIFSEVYPMPDDVPIEDCASFFVNPYTAVGIVDTATKEGSTKAIVHTAAASQLGQMLNKLASSKGMEVINVVRRPEQKELLEKLGAKHIVVTTSEQEEIWKAELKDKIKELGATCAFDAVSGDMTGHIMDVMPKGGVVYLYGNLAGRANGIDPTDLIYRRKQLKSFYLTNWIRNGGPMVVPRMLLAGRTVSDGLREGGWCQTQFVDTTMEKVQEDIIKLLEGGVKGKKLRVRF
jgi:NADPH:quinone reductase-like Zn-dependent oxidoreductase